MGSSITLSRKDYEEGIEHVSGAVQDGAAYLDQFTVTFPDGLNTASSLEICRLMQNPDFEQKDRIMRICVAGKNVEVTCPNGDVEKFCLSNPNDSLDALPLFQKEPLARIAIADSIYGWLLKKSLRLSTAAKPEVADQTSKE